MIIKSYIDLRSALTHLNNSNLISYDIETDGLNVRKNKIIGFGFATSENNSFYLPLMTFDGKELKYTQQYLSNWHTQLLDIIKTKQIICHNAYFDMEMTLNFLKINLYNSLKCDTILLKHTVDEERPFGLKDIAKKLYGADSNQEMKEMKESIKQNGGKPNDYYKADMEIMGKYCAKDCELTYRIFKYYSDILQKENLQDFFYDIEVMPLFKEVTVPMQRKGIPLNLELLKSAKADILKDIDELEDSIQKQIRPYLNKFEKWYLGKEFPPRRSGHFAQMICEYADLELPKTAKGQYSIRKSELEKLPSSEFKTYLLGGEYLDDEIVEQIQRLCWRWGEEKYMFNLQSKHHWKKLFFEILDETAINHTDKGSPQVDELFLNSIKDKYNFVNDLITFNKLNKIYSTYIDRFLEAEENGIFHPAYHQHRTISGRYGSDLQQLNRPLDKQLLDSGEVDSRVFKYNNLIRKFFIAGDGHKFIDSDYESLEPHVFSHVSGDDRLKDIFRNGHDFYSTIAIRTENLKELSADKKADNYLGNVDKTKRQKAKAYSLGVPYGMGGYALSKHLKIKDYEGEKLVQDYLNAFPDLKKWMLWSDSYVKENGYMKSEAGRIRHMKSACKIWRNYGDEILDSLKIWKKYHEDPAKYKQVKYLRKEFKNYLNNGKNFQIQSLSASIVNRAAIEINRELKKRNIDGYVCAQIHDQLIVRVPENISEECKKLVQDKMENTYKLSVDLKAPAEIANDFYEGH